jgi:hypothetical protein
MLGGAPSPWTCAADEDDLDERPAPARTWLTSRQTRPDGLVITAIVRGRTGAGASGVSNSPSSASRP